MDEQPDARGTTASSTTSTATSGSSPRARPAPSSGSRRTPRPQGTVPDAHDPSKRHAPMMLTTDLALRIDPVYDADHEALPRAPGPARRRVREGLVQAAAPRHGPASRATSARGSRSRSSGRTRSPRSTTTWSTTPDVAAAEAHDPRLGAVGRAARVDGVGVGGELPRHRQARRRERRAHPPRAAEGLGGQRAGRAGRGAAEARADPAGLQRRAVRREAGLARRRDRARRLRGSRAGGARTPGVDVTVPFAPGRTDASQEQTDVDSFAVLEPHADGFRNYLRPGDKLPPETRLLDRANLLTLTAPEMTVLVGGMRALDANCGRLAARRLHRPARDADERLLRATCSTRARSGRRRRRRRTSTRAATWRPAQVKWTATAADLVFGSNSQLRALAEVYARRRRRGRSSSATSWPRGSRS